MYFQEQNLKVASENGRVNPDGCVFVERNFKGL